MLDTPFRGTVPEDPGEYWLQLTNLSVTHRRLQKMGFRATKLTRNKKRWYQFYYLYCTNNISAVILICLDPREFCFIIITTNLPRAIIT